MRRPRTLACAAATAVLLCGCSVEFGGHMGVGSVAKNPPNLMWASHSMANLNVSGLLVGAELESRAEANIGGRWNTGLQLGYAHAPTGRKAGALGGEVHADFGTRIDGAIFFPNGDFYWGATGALVIWLYPDREFSNVNTDEWVFSKALELVPYVRARFHYDHDQVTGLDPQINYDFGAGVALRVHFVSDFM